MFRDDLQRSEACRLLLASLHLDRLWTDRGPSDEACALLEARGGYLSGGESVLLLVAFDFWNSGARTPLSDVLYRLDGERLELVATLMIALGQGAHAIDQWVMDRLHELVQEARACCAEFETGSGEHGDECEPCPRCPAAGRCVRCGRVSP